MTIVAPAAELEQSYEALRAQAAGEIPSCTPRGLAVFLAHGMSAWMCACPPRPRPTPTPPTSPASAENIDAGLAGVSGELVRLLAAMVISRQGRCVP